MKINRVTMAGFGPYRSAQTVDFDAFDDDGIFLIGGKTGAGKSTILDAICFALYGSVPRYEGQAAAATKLRSDHCAPDDPSFVELEFTAGSGRYLLRRSPEYDRPKTRGGGFTTQKAEAELSRWEAGGWVGLEAQLRTVGVKVAEIVQLSQEQFLQVILLAQNRFQEFLLAKSEERQSLLRTLFDTRRFDDYDEALQARRKALESEALNAQGEIDRLARQLAGLVGEAPTQGAGDSGGEEAARLVTEIPAEPAEVVDWMGARVAVQKDRVAIAQREVERADSAWNAARAEHDRLAELGRLQRRRDEAVARREQLRAREAELAAATAQALDAAGVHVGEVSSLDAAESGLLELSGSLAIAAEAEKSLPSMRRAVTAAEAGCEQADAALEAEKQRAPQWREDLATIGPQIEEAAEAAADQRAAEQLAAGISPALTALAAIPAAQQACEAAERAELESGRARTAASRALDELRARRLEGHAAELASDLAEGDPCPVCGSTHHPVKAVWTGEAVTESDVDAAEAALAAADSAATRRSRDAGDARAQLAELHGAAGGHTVESAQAVHAEAAARLKAAKAAAQRAVELRTRRETLEMQLAGHEARLDILRAACESAAARRTTERVALDQAVKTVDSALAGNRSVAERLTALGAAMRGAREVRQRLREHETAVAAVDATLHDPEVQQAPAGSVELNPAREALEQASQARDAARDARATRAAHLATAEELLAGASAARERSADLARRFAVVQRLANTVHGLVPNSKAMRLESFVLAAELEEIVHAANARLTQMSGGRYLLEHSDERAARGAQSGLGLAILDQHTGLARPTQSLSGGETFLASLALALGLAEVVTGRAGGITLDTLFIDEGFGSLDSETLEVAMGTLDSLRTGGRTIGLISHVEAMKEQIPAKLQVDVADGGWSVITQA